MIENSIKLFKGDCLDVLKNIQSNSVDLVLIDPPYEISRSSGFTRGGDSSKYGNFEIDFGEWDYNFDVMEQVINECYRVLKQGGTLLCFYDLWKITTLKDYMDNAKFKQIRFIEWIKTNPVPVNSKLNYLTNAREIAISGVKGGKPTFNSSYDNGIYNYPINHEKGRFHPTQKPINLISDLVKKHSNEGDLVLDCFMGSGTTGVCCKQLNRSFIGVEIDDEYFLKASLRIEQTSK